jgi:hypothetical protein
LAKSPAAPCKWACSRQTAQLRWKKSRCIGPAFDKEISIYTIALTSLSHDRILSGGYAEAEDTRVEVTEPQQEEPRQSLTA